MEDLWRAALSELSIGVDHPRPGSDREEVLAGLHRWSSYAV
jgi:hypothetical protein